MRNALPSFLSYHKVEHINEGNCLDSKGMIFFKNVVKIFSISTFSHGINSTELTYLCFSLLVTTQKRKWKWACVAEATAKRACFHEIMKRD
jgi:hypothetical protein